MKYRYDKEDDVLMVWFSRKKIDHAEKGKNVIVHFSPKNEMVLMEILDASKFLKDTSRVIPQDIRQQVFAA